MMNANVNVDAATKWVVQTDRKTLLPSGMPSDGNVSVEMTVLFPYDGVKDQKKENQGRIKFSICPERDAALFLAFKSLDAKAAKSPVVKGVEKYLPLVRENKISDGRTFYNVYVNVDDITTVPPFRKGMKLCVKGKPRMWRDGNRIGGVVFGVESITEPAYVNLKEYAFTD